MRPDRFPATTASHEASAGRTSLPRRWGGAAIGAIGGFYCGAFLAILARLPMLSTAALLAAAGAIAAVAFEGIGNLLSDFRTLQRAEGNPARPSAFVSSSRSRLGALAARPSPAPAGRAHGPAVIPDSQRLPVVPKSHPFEHSLSRPAAKIARSWRSFWRRPEARWHSGPGHAEAGALVGASVGAAFEAYDASALAVTFLREGPLAAVARVISDIGGVALVGALVGIGFWLYKTTRRRR